MNILGKWHFEKLFLGLPKILAKVYKYGPENWSTLVHLFSVGFLRQKLAGSRAIKMVSDPHL